MPKFTQAQMKQLMAASKAAKRKPSKPRTLPASLPKPVKQETQSERLKRVEGEIRSSFDIQAQTAAKELLRRKEAAMTTKLLACPFCGFHAVRVETGIAAYKFVRCDNTQCEARGPRGSGDDIATAVKLWNKAKR